MSDASLPDDSLSDWYRFFFFFLCFSLWGLWLLWSLFFPLLTSRSLEFLSISWKKKNIQSHPYCHKEHNHKSRPETPFSHCFHKHYKYHLCQQHLELKLKLNYHFHHHHQINSPRKRRVLWASWARGLSWVWELSEIPASNDIIRRLKAGTWVEKCLTIIKRSLSVSQEALIVHHEWTGLTRTGLNCILRGLVNFHNIISTTGGTSICWELSIVWSRPNSRLNCKRLEFVAIENVLNG